MGRLENNDIITAEEYEELISYVKNSGGYVFPQSQPLVFEVLFKNYALAYKFERHLLKEHKAVYCGCPTPYLGNYPMSDSIEYTVYVSILGVDGIYFAW
jgi:hypothetical protein